jgi:hypothetical protein
MADEQMISLHGVPRKSRKGEGGSECRHLRDARKVHAAKEKCLANRRAKALQKGLTFKRSGELSGVILRPAALWLKAAGVAV